MELPAVDTVDITPNYDNLRAFMRRAWSQPGEKAFRASVREDPKMLAWLQGDEPLPDPDAPKPKGRQPAIMVDCPGLADGVAAHAMRDGCWNCAPFWEHFPICPTHRVKLTTTGYCKQCKRHYSYDK